ncbi:MAG: PEP-CTERM sorting domain-containing protein [Bryobacteraceae bacterium]
MQRTGFISALGILAIAGTLHASTFSFSTPTGAKDVNGVDPVAASAIFAVSANTITITLNNLEANPTEDAQILDALTFQLNNQTIGGTLTVSMAETEFVKVNDNDTYTQVTTNLPAWNLSDTVVGSTIDFSFCNAKVTGTNCTSTGTKPLEGGIIGAPSGSDYTNANSTIKGSTANPYIFEDAVITIKMTSGTFDTAQSDYTNLLFGYGDTTGQYEAVGGEAPEPSSFWMMAAALALGLAAFRYRRADAPVRARPPGRAPSSDCA